MAAMAPALTDAPAEAHHIRFKLAAPSSSLSPGSTENNGNASNILIHSSATAVKRKGSAAEDRALDYCGGNKNQEQQPQSQQLHHQDSTPSTLGKLQPLVASFLCADVTPVPPTKESIKLQGVLIKQSVLKSHSILPNSIFNGGSDFLLRKRQTLELSGGQLKSLMSGSPNSGSQLMAPVNGLAKKLAMSGAGCVMAVNRSKPSASVTESQSQAPPLNSKDPAGTASGHALLATPKPKHSGVSHSAGGNCVQSPTSSSTHSATSPSHGSAKHDRLLNSECQEAKSDTPTDPLQASAMDEEQSSPVCSLVPNPPEAGGSSQRSSPACTPIPDTPTPPDTQTLDSLDAQVRERTLLSSSRQGDIEGRLRRLRKRLQVVQAKQVERHLQQQLGGFLDSALSRMPAASRRADAAVTPTATWRTGRQTSSSGDCLSRFLRSGSVPSELERLYFSGTANLHSTESAFDSDVTESSSGGDTDLEEEELSRVDIEQRHVKILKRAESLYTVERASIISHWNWLQANISDLEYRIRQQTDIHRQIRSGKGVVELGGLAPSPLPAGGLEVKAEPVSTQDGISERLEHKVTAHLTTAESGHWKGQNGRPVNGIYNRVGDSTDQKPGTKHHPTPNHSTCVAARTRPLLSCKRRRLVQPNTIPNLDGKAQRSTSTQCSCRVNASCVTCGGRPAPREDPRYELSTLERLSWLDPGVHPILSFTDDVCVSLRLQELLQSQPSKALDRPRPLKKLSLKHKLSSKDKHKLPNSLLTVRLGHSKSQKVKQRQLQLDGGSGTLGSARLEGPSLCIKTERLSPPAGSYNKSYGRSRPRQHSLHTADRESPTASRASPKLFVDLGSPCSSMLSLHSSTHSPLLRQLSTSSESNTPLGPNTPQPIRRRRGESSFDINNIVIPMSVAATTRVEKLQYKEILTPSWREVDIFSQPAADEDHDYEMEDLSDAAFTQHHQPCEDQERARFSWLALAPAKRRGSRSYKSMDGRTTPLLCGTNPPTPQPASPDPGHYALYHDYSCVPSPMSPPSPDATSQPYTPCSRDSHRLLSNEDTRCSTPDFTFEERTVAPWERRTFPLAEDPVPEPQVEHTWPRAVDDTSPWMKTPPQSPS